MASTNFSVSKTSEKTVSVGGTAERIASGYSFFGLSFSAKDDNKGRIYVGGADIATTTNNGFKAGEGQSLRFNSPTDIGSFWVNADNAGEGIDFTATLRQ